MPSRASSPATSQCAGASSSTACRLASAAPDRSAATRCASRARSVCTCGATPGAASSRASTSNCSIRRAARSQPSSVLCSAWRRSSVLSAPSATWGLRADRRHRRAQFVGGIGRETPLRLEQGRDAREQAVECLHQRPHLCRCIGEADGVECMGPALRQPLAQLLQGRQAAPHGPPAEQGEQGQRHQQGPQAAAQQRTQDVAARVGELGHVDLHIPFGAAGGDDAPAPAVDHQRLEATRVARHRRGRRIARAQHQHAFVPDLEGDTACITAQRLVVGLEGLVGAVARIGLLRHQQRGSLRQMAVEQLIEFVAGVDPDRHRRGQPHTCHHRHQQRQQARLQRQRLRVHAGPSRRTSA